MKMLRALLLVAALLAAAGSQGTAAAPAAAKFRDGEVLVKFAPGADKPGILKALKATQKNVIATDNNGELVLAGLPPGLSVASAVDAFKSRAGIAYAEPNFQYTKVLTPNDPFFTSSSSMWGMRTGFGSNAQTAWDTTTDCSTVYVGIVDEGIQYTHPDLAANIWTNPDEVAGDGIDNDGTGYADDVHGYDFVNRKGDVFTATDGDEHGTHVAGTIGAVGNNGVGVVGVCHRVQLISAKFLGPNGGYLSDAVLALDYITRLKTLKKLNIVATSNSWGCGTSCFSQSLLDAINRGNNAGILFIAAAGNEATSTVSYPGGFQSPAVIAVASINSAGSISSFSNRGSTWVHLGAPGESILSTVPTDGYAAYSGTSMACPHVTGAAALYKARYPNATAADVKNAILKSVAATSSLSTTTITGGRLDAAKMLGVPPPSVCSPACASNQFCSQQVCTNCPVNCVSCTSSTQCTACLTGYTGATCSQRVATCGSSGSPCSKNGQCCSGLCGRKTKVCA